VRRLVRRDRGGPAFEGTDQKTRRAIRKDPGLAEERCRQNVDAVELAMGEIRRHLRKGASGSLEAVDLVSTLRNLAEVMDRQGQVPVQFEVESLLEYRLAPGVALQMTQIAHEAISNAQRHSGAEGVRLGLRNLGGRLEMTIVDNGRGFDPDRLSGTGYGLRNMADRARDIGAEYELLARPGDGVRLTVRLPGVTEKKQETTNEL
jgi:two-component system, NarL family, sensor histidine kinase UhpB